MRINLSELQAHAEVLVCNDEKSHCEHGQRSRPVSCTELLELAFCATDLGAPCEVEEMEWKLRLYWRMGTSLDVHHNAKGEFSCFNFLCGWSPETRSEVRKALQVCLPQAIKPAEQFMWSNSRWREVVKLACPSDVEVWVNHAPLETTIGVAVRVAASHLGVPAHGPDLCKLVLRHQDEQRYCGGIVNEEGNADLLAGVRMLLEQSGYQVGAK